MNQQPSELTAPAAGPLQEASRSARAGKFRFSVAQFLMALVLLLVVAPFVDDFKYGESIDAVFMSLVLISGVLAVGRNRRTLALAALLMLPALAARWGSHFQPELLPVQNLAALVFIGFVEFQLLRFIFRARRVDSEVLCAGISSYLLLGVLWMSAYMLASQLNPVDATHPGAFSFNIGSLAPHPLGIFDAYYFSFITLSTVGYGDITPLSHGARTLAMTEAMTGTLYVAVLISRLVALYTSQAQTADEARRAEANKP